MQRLNRKDINTIDYWNGLYTKGERAGWFHHPKKEGSIKTFFHQEIQEMIENGGYNFIEIGGGTGLGVEIVRKDYPDLECFNLDISSKAVERGKVKYPKVRHICHDLKNDTEVLKLSDTFSILICQEVIEHLERIQISINYIMKLVKLGGVCFFSFPFNEQHNGGAEHIYTFDYNSIYKLFFKYTDEVTVCNYQPFINSKHLHLAVKFFKTKE